MRGDGHSSVQIDARRKAHNLVFWLNLNWRWAMERARWYHRAGIAAMSLSCIGLACAPPGLKNREHVGEEALAVQDDGDLGDQCKKDGDCLANEMCASLQCACAPGLVACAKKCVDLATDPHHCGACKHECTGDVPCAAGSCGPPSPKDAFELDGGSAATSCIVAQEGYPEVPLTYGTAAIDMPFSGPYLNWGSSPTSWNSPYQNIPSGGVSYGDAWATTSGYTGLEYVSNIFQSGGQYCIGMAATDATSMASGSWTYPFACATNLNGSALTDGPSIYYDPGAENLFAVNYVPANKNIQLHIFPTCNAGQPGGPNCPEESFSGGQGVTVGQSYGHATVNVNPCTHHAIVAFNEYNAGLVLVFFNAAGSQIASYTIDSSASLSPPTDCNNSNCSGCVPKCGGQGSSDCGGTGCARLASHKVHLATKYDSGSGNCYAFVGYTSSYTSNLDSHTYWLAAFARVNITTESSIPWPPSPWLTYPPYPFNWKFNAYGTTVSANANSNSVGWFFYDQESPGGNDPCNTYYRAETNTNLGVGGWNFQTLDGPFPTVEYAAGADYVGAVKRGLGGGDLFPSWHRSLVTSSGCISCLQQQYDLAIYGAEVTP